MNHQQCGCAGKYILLHNTLPLLYLLLGAAATKSLENLITQRDEKMQQALPKKYSMTISSPRLMSPWIGDRTQRKQLEQEDLCPSIQIQLCSHRRSPPRRPSLAIFTRCLTGNPRLCDCTRLISAADHSQNELPRCPRRESLVLLIGGTLSNLNFRLGTHMKIR